MKAEEIQKLLEQQQQEFNKKQMELQQHQNQQLLLQQKQIAELIEKLGSKEANNIEKDKSADYGLPDCGSELKQNCIRLIENKIKKNEDCTLKDLLNDCKIFLATKKEVKLLSESKQEPKLQSIEKKSPTKHWNNYPTNYRQPPKIPYCNHCKKDGHWTLNCYFAGSNENGPYCALLDIDDKKNVIQKENWIVQQLKINGNSIDMIVDTAAQITIISKDCWQEIGKPELQEISYTGSGLGNSKFNIEGKFMAKIEYKNKHEELDCHVVDGKFNLIGLPWLKKLKILKNIRIQPLIENQPSPKKKIVWQKQNL